MGGGFKLVNDNGFLRFGLFSILFFIFRCGCGNGLGERLVLGLFVFFLEGFFFVEDSKLV